MEGTMKKLTLITLALVLLFALAASSQEAKVGKISFGIKAGINMSTLKGDSLASLLEDMAQADALPAKKSRTGVGAGAFFSYSVTPFFAVQPELLYVQKGCKFDFTGGGATTVKSAWLEIPVLLKFTPQLQGSKIAPAIFAGPFIGLNMSAEFQQSGFAADVEVPGDFDAKDSLKSTDFGITFGGGLGYKLTKGEIFFDVRYDLGLTKVLKSGILNRPESQADTKTSTFLILVGYKFDI
jgi:opacity protein-like surface antigen